VLDYPGYGAARAETAWHTGWNRRMSLVGVLLAAEVRGEGG
jgi:hypothetical protein